MIFSDVLNRAGKIHLALRQLRLGDARRAAEGARKLAGAEQELRSLRQEREEVRVRILEAAIGAITESDVELALTSPEDTIIVGAFNDDSPLSNGGSAYVFVRNGSTWTQQQKLTASDGTADDEFGNAVAVAGDVFCRSLPGLVGKTNGTDKRGEAIDRRGSSGNQ